MAGSDRLLDDGWLTGMLLGCSYSLAMSLSVRLQRRSSKRKPSAPTRLAPSQTLTNLSAKQRRQVRQAVARGRVVADPELAPVAISYAQTLLDATSTDWSLTRPSGWRSVIRVYHTETAFGRSWLIVSILIAFLSIPVIPSDPGVTLTFLGFYLLLTLSLLWHFATNTPRRAQEAKDANQGRDAHREEFWRGWH